MDIACLNLLEVVVEYLCHWAAGDVGALLRESAVGKVSASVLGVCHVDIGDDIHDAAVGLLWEAFVLATVTCLHVEDRDMEALCTNDAQARVGVAKDENCIRTCGCKEFVRAVDDVATGGAKVIAHSIHIDLRIGKLQVAEEDAVEVVVVVLAGVRQDDIEVLAAGVDDGCQADDLRTCAHDNDEFELTIVLEVNVAIIKFRLLFHKTRIVIVFLNTNCSNNSEITRFV